MHTAVQSKTATMVLHQYTHALSSRSACLRSNWNKAVRHYQGTRPGAHCTCGTLVFSNRNGASHWSDWSWSLKNKEGHVRSRGCPLQQQAVDAKKLLDQRAVVRSKQPNGDSPGAELTQRKGCITWPFTAPRDRSARTIYTKNGAPNATCRHLSKDAPGVEERPSEPSVVQWRGRELCRGLSVCTCRKGVSKCQQSSSVQASKCRQPKVSSVEGKGWVAVRTNLTEIGSGQSAGPPPSKHLL